MRTLRMNQQALIEQVEGLVDANSLFDVVIALHLMCLEKGEHLRCNWQVGLDQRASDKNKANEAAAKAWERAATVLAACARTKAVGVVSE